MRLADRDEPTPVDAGLLDGGASAITVREGGRLGRPRRQETRPTSRADGAPPPPYVAALDAIVVAAGPSEMGSPSSRQPRADGAENTARDSRDNFITRCV